MNRRVALAAFAAVLGLQPIAALADWLNDVPAAVGLVGCKRDGPDDGRTQWHCPEQRHPLPPKPNGPLLQWHQTAPFIGEAAWTNGGKGPQR